jgi:AraC-like DNA-binding protein/mannose-6-phosphate isomerase-like protein (cupin superfamily)
MSNVHFEMEFRTGEDEIGKRAKLLYVSMAKYGGDWHSTPHTHACTELFYVVGGLGQFRIADQLRPVSAGDMVIVNPGVEHTEISLSANPLEYIVLGVEGLEFAFDQGPDQRYGVIGFQDQREELSVLLRALLEEIETKPPQYRTVCQDLLEILILRLIRRTDCAGAAAAAGRRINRECSMVRRYLDSHFKENVTLDQLAEMAHVNKYHMVHAFTREYGVSPINYLTTRRIRESCRLLSGTDHSLAQISQMLGFSSPSYFSQRFKKMEGVSPMEYRKGRRAAREASNEEESL